MNTVRLSPSVGKYLEVISNGRPVGIWKIFPADGQPGTPFEYNQAIDLLKKYSADLTVLPVKVGIKMVSPIKVTDLVALNDAVMSNRAVPANLDNSVPIDSSSTIEAQARTIASLTEQNAALLKSQQAQEARLAALEASLKKNTSKI